MTVLEGQGPNVHEWTRDDERLARPYYENAADGRIVLPYCTGCENFHWYPEIVCPRCQAAGWEWRQVTPRSRLFTWMRVEHAFTTELKDKVPFFIALVEMVGAPSVRLITNLVDLDPADLREGMELVGTFREPVWSTDKLPLFTPA